MTAASNNIDLSRAQWRKSTRSSAEGQNCVEVASAWRKSMRSTPEGANCVEVAALSQLIAVRDSKNPDGGKLIFTGESWRRFADDVKRGRYEL
jgi:hypothetical protein